MQAADHPLLVQTFSHSSSRCHSRQKLAAAVLLTFTQFSVDVSGRHSVKHEMLIGVPITTGGLMCGAMTG